MKDKMMDDDVENVGIMQGFLDKAGEEEDELEEEEDSDEASTARVMDRRPNSPEIIMNNLRGDMRSVDARREELADLVGFQAAAETPDAVLAMLQPVLAQQGGLGALPQSGPMAQGPQPPMPPPPGGVMGSPPPGAPPLSPSAAPPIPGGMAAPAGLPPGGGMAPPMIGPDGQPIPPEGMPPIQMKDGGLVQYFQDGSDEEGVTPEEDNSPSSMQVTPQMLEMARQGYTSMLSSRPSPEPGLQSRVAEKEKLYGELLGDDRNMQQAQLLFALAQKGLQFAGNVDAQGRPLRGSPISRLATVAADLPATINQFISDADKRRMNIRMAALQAAEKEMQAKREGDLSLIETQRKAFGDILRNAGKTPGSMFGKGAWDWSVVNTPGLLQAYADGETTPEEDNLITSAASRLLRERTEYTTNELGQVVPYVVPGYDLPFLRDAMAQRQALNAAGPTAGPATTGTVPVGPGTTPPEAAVPPVSAPAQGVEQPVSAEVTSGERQFAEPTLWAAAQEGIGFIPKLTSELARRVPLEIAGEMGRTQQQAAATVTKLAPRVALALRETTRLSNAEREDINANLNIDPKLFENRVGYLNNLVSLGQVLYRIRNDALDKASDRTLAVQNANEQRFKAREIQAIIDLVGIPPVVSTREEYLRLPIGAQFLVFNREKQAWVPDTRKPLPDEQ